MATTKTWGRIGGLALGGAILANTCSMLLNIRTMSRTKTTLAEYRQKTDDALIDIGKAKLRLDVATAGLNRLSSDLSQLTDKMKARYKRGDCSLTAYTAHTGTGAAEGDTDANAAAN